VSEFSDNQWSEIQTLLERQPAKYGLPERVYGSVLLGSFNIRKLGARKNRSDATWRFLARVCSQFDLLAVQEVQDDLGGLRHLMSLLGPDFGLIASDVTGVFPGEPGLAERHAFIFNWKAVQRTEIASDISYDRSRVLNTLAVNLDEIQAAMAPYGAYLRAVDAWEQGGKQGPKPQKVDLKMPLFLTFIRQPFCVSMKIGGHPGTKPYEFLAVNAHLYYGQYLTDRRQEFDALMNWLLARVVEDANIYAPNFLLFGDLNLDFDSPESDRARIEKYMKSLNSNSGDEVFVNFPFLEPHPGQSEVFRTNARLNQTFDQIGLFCRDPRFPNHRDNLTMGRSPVGPDYGVFNFVDLFAEALHGRPFAELGFSEDEKKAFYGQFEHTFSDHMPIWLRLPLP